MKKFLVGLVLVLALVAGGVPDSTPKAEALSVEDVKDFVVNAPDAVFEGFIGAVGWTVEKVVAACEQFAVCNWAMEEIESVVVWLNSACDEFFVCSWTKDTFSDVSDFLQRKCGEVVVCDSVVAWTTDHPGWALGLQLGVISVLPGVGQEVVLRSPGGPVGRMIDETVLAVRTYVTDRGVEFDVPIFARLRKVCYAKGCGEWVPVEKRDPVRLLKGEERDRILDTVCDEELCRVGGKEFPRSEATVDHQVPWSCGGATSAANSVVMQRDENIAKGGCSKPIG